MDTKGLAGTGMQQSPEQWAERGRILADGLSRLVQMYRPATSRTGLDVGCQDGTLTDALALRTGLQWSGIDPGIARPRTSLGGAELLPGWAHELPFADAEFDVLAFANVYEHVLPEQRLASLREMSRVLKPGGLVVGQLPNPYFPIESHSRLPFMGWLPIGMQKRYWKLAPVPWGHDFFSVTSRDLVRDARSAELAVLHLANFNYPPEVIPRALQWAARAVQPVTRRFPWAWQFVLKKAG